MKVTIKAKHDLVLDLGHSFTREAKELDLPDDHVAHLKTNPNLEVVNFEASPKKAPAHEPAPLEPVPSHSEEKPEPPKGRRGK